MRIFCWTLFVGKRDTIEAASREESVDGEDDASEDEDSDDATSQNEAPKKGLYIIYFLI